MFVFRFDATLLKLTQNKPALEPLFQLPPTSRPLPLFLHGDNPDDYLWAALGEDEPSRCAAARTFFIQAPTIFPTSLIFCDQTSYLRRSIYSMDTDSRTNERSSSISMSKSSNVVFL